MANTGVTINVNTDDLLRACRRANLVVQNVVSERIEDEAKGYQRDIRKKITSNRSVVTGDLRRSIKIEKRHKFEYIVGTNLFYAPFVEFGARNRGGGMRRGKPYIQPVHDDRKDGFIRDLERLIDEGLR